MIEGLVLIIKLIHQNLQIMKNLAFIVYYVLIKLLFYSTAEFIIIMITILFMGTNDSQFIIYSMYIFVILFKKKVL